MKMSDLAYEENGNMLILVTETDEPSFTVTRCDAVGKPLAIMEVAMPANLKMGFAPDSIFCQGSRICLLDREAGKGAIFDGAARFIKPMKAVSDGEAVVMVDDLAGTALSVSDIAVSSPVIRLMRAFFAPVKWITKPSSSRNGNEPVKSRFSRNGLLIDRTGKYSGE